MSVPWFEPTFLAILKHEYRGSMRFNSDESVVHRLVAPADPCSLYVHVPFCEALCPFCSFHRVLFREEKARAYFSALRDEIRSYHARGFQFSNVYVGGGTPTVALEELVETLGLICSLWPVQTLSVETNPNHLTEPVFRALRSVDVGRLSVGVQSFDDGLLRQMERYDRYGSGGAILERLAAAKGVFRTLSVDMIFNLPNQTQEMLEEDLRKLKELRVDQISFYPLMTAATARHRMEHTLGANDPRRRHDFFAHIHEAMKGSYRSSSAWCFSLDEGPEAAARTIDEYIIDQDNYVGVGSGSFSYVDGWMYSTTFSLNQYRERIKQGRTAITQSKRLTLKERMRYDYLVHLFGLSMSYEYILRKYGARFWLLMAPEVLSMRMIGATRYDEDSIRLTPMGRYCWVLMMAEFFNSVNAFRDQMRLKIRDELEERVPAEALVPVSAVGRAM